MQTPKNTNDLIHNYVWCIAGKPDGQWLHHLACKHRQNKLNNDCPSKCDWYKAPHKLNDKKGRTESTILDYLKQEDTIGIKKDLDNAKTREQKYIASIPKEIDNADLHKQTQNTRRNMQTHNRRKTRATKK